jgi:hypothetical protein
LLILFFVYLIENRKSLSKLCSETMHVVVQNDKNYGTIRRVGNHSHLCRKPVVHHCKILKLKMIRTNTIEKHLRCGHENMSNHGSMLDIDAQAKH